MHRHQRSIFDHPQLLSVAGGPLRVYQGGPETGRPPILLLHGAMYDRADLCWLHVADQLARGEEGHPGERVMAIDLPRHGGSRPWHGTLDQPRLEKIVIALLDQLGIDLVLLVGLSLGGAVSIGLTLHHPDRVAGAVLINPGGIGERLAQHGLTWAYTRTPGLDRLTATMLAGNEAWAKKSLAAALHRGAETPGFDRLLELTLAEARARAENRERAMDDWQHAVIGPSRIKINFARPGEVDGLARITRPTVWLHGAADPLVSRAEIDAAVAATPGARLVVAERAGHVLAVDRPEVVVREVRALVDRLAAGFEVSTELTTPAGPRQADPGMTTKMGPKAFTGIVALSRGEQIDESAITPLLEFIDARVDCADFRLIVVLKALLAYGDHLSEPTRQAIRRSVLGFRYWMDEPGTDGMCHWSENHQILFAVAEHLAGRHFATEVFTNGMTGAERRDRARIRIDRWLAHRFRHGFSEWLSNTYYEEDVAALSVLIDHTDDDQLRVRATMIMDLIMLDLAMHRFGGRFVGTSGRCYEQQKKDPAAADVNPVLAHACGDPSGGDAQIDEQSLSILFALGDYRVPAVIKEIANDPTPVTIRQSTGLDLDEVEAEFAGADPLHEKAMFLWAMEAFTNPESINSSAAVLEAWPQMRGNTFIAGLAPFVPWRRTGLLPALIHTLNPATRGVAIQRADIVTRRTPHWLLSSAQRHHPGTFGDQQHLWQATLPGDLSVFTTHPARPMFDDNARNFSPSAWVGNGIMPDVAQHEGVLLVRHDNRGRPGLLERGRLRLSHLHWPRGRFDETIESGHRLVGRAGESLIGVLALRPVRDGSRDEVISDGIDTAWAVICGDTARDGSLAEFSAFLDVCTLTAEADGIRLQLPVEHQLATEDRRPTRYELRRRGPWLVDGNEISTDFDRYDTPWVSSPRRPGALRISHGPHELIMDWVTAHREER
ncbi:alpha/beta fold hydrolase [Propionibacteriaceae bacterium Y1700]|uniref:alpha/beta fold hydrolase n=1 Tax=Microlunatus sp. Y1700 TaxID=3418487 RepID=UPI003DA71F11